MFEEIQKLKARAESIKIDKTPQTTKLGIEFQKKDQNGDWDNFEAMINGDDIHNFMPEVIAELMYAYSKTELVKDGDQIHKAHQNAKEFTKQVLCGKEFGMEEEKLERILNTHIDEKKIEKAEEEEEEEE